VKLLKKTEIYKKTVTTMVLALLIISSAFLVFSNSAIPTVNAAIPSDLLQYEWTQPVQDASRSCFSPGPGPTTPHVKWRTTIDGAPAQPVAFNGKVFVQDSSIFYPEPGWVPSTYCLDAASGEIIYKLEGVFGSICKLDNTYMLIGSNCYKIADGSLAWEGPPGFGFGSNMLFGGMGAAYTGGGGYIAELKMLVNGNVAWSLADSSQPPTIAWNRADEPDFGDYGAESAKTYGSGVIVYTTGFQYIRGVDATTGKTLWTTPITIVSWTYDSSAIDGVFGFGALDGNFYGWNITTGDLMWTYNPGTFYNQFASGSGAAYGMFYAKNQDTYTYAINATTGELVWRYDGPGVAYSNTLTIAGGKVYAQTGENQYVDFDTGEPGHSEFACLDAFTGEVIWTEPFENGAPFNYQCNAYGNLYIVPTISQYTPGVFTYTGYGSTYDGPNEIWCISDEPADYPMFLNDPENSGYGDGPTTLQLKWTVTTGEGMVSSPTLVNGVAYVGSYDGNIYAFDANTGTEVWTYQTGKIGFSSTVAVVNNKLYTGADDGKVYCLNADTGTKLWEASAGGVSATGSPTVAGGMVYVAGGNNNLYCFNANTGALVWNYDAGGSISSQTPAVVDGAVYFGANGVFMADAGPHIIKLDAITGEEMLNIVIPVFIGGASFFPNMGASVTTGGGMVFARTSNRYNYAINASTGEVVWMVDARYNPGTPEQVSGASQTCAMLYKYGTVYFSDFYSITALNALNGSEIWSTYISRESLAPGLSYSYGRIYAVNEAGSLYVLDALTGEKYSFYQFGATTLHSTPTPYNGSLYVSTLDWDLYCFEEAPPQEFHGALSTTITVTVAPDFQTWGKDVLLKGTVSNAPGAQVHLTAIDPNKNFQDIGTVTSDDSGFYRTVWTPPVPGIYDVTASFEGSGSYLPSSAKTAFVVEEASTAAQPIEPEPAAPAPAEPTATEPTQPAAAFTPTEPPPAEPTATTEAPLITTELAVIIAAAIIAIALITGFWILRKRK